VYVKNGCDLKTDEGSEENTAATSASKTTESGRVAEEAGVYPNPFNGSFSLTYTAKANDKVKVELYNLMGMKVSELLELTVEANTTYQWSFDNSLLTANEYVLVVKGSKSQQVIRLIQKR
jgi:serine protease AprX